MLGKVTPPFLLLLAAIAWPGQAETPALPAGDGIHYAAFLQLAAEPTLAPPLTPIPQKSEETGPFIELPTDMPAIIPGRFTTIPANTNGKMVRWRSRDAGLALVPVDSTKDSLSAIVIGLKEGTYTLEAWTALGDVPTGIAECVVIVDDGIDDNDPPAPEPGPEPPVPPKPPTPDTKPPFPTDDLAVLVVYEKTGAPLPENIYSIVYGKAVREFLDAKAGKGDWRIYDPQIDVTRDAAKWQAAMSVKRDSLPWVVISNGKTGYSGPIPASMTPAEFQALVSKYAE